MDIDLSAKAEGPPGRSAEHKAQVEAFQQAQQDQNKPIEAGDVVALPSGGKLMTVMKLDGQRATVAWFDERDCLHQQYVDVGGLNRRSS